MAQSARIQEPAEERWLPVVGYEGFYEVSDLGRVRRMRHGRAVHMLRPGWRDSGYPYVILSVGAVRKPNSVHILVTRAFLGPCPPGHEVDHEDRRRGDSRLSNLRYLTKEENQKRKLCGSCSHTGHSWCGEYMRLTAASRSAKLAAKRNATVDPKTGHLRPRRRLIARLREAVLAGRMSLEQADAALVRR